MNLNIAYLTSLYPAPSHTFIRREVEELRRQGLNVHTFSVRRPSPEQCRSAEDKASADTTYYLLPVNIPLYLREHAQAMTRTPFAYMRTFLHAVQHRAPGLKALIWAMAHFLEAIVFAAELKRRNIHHVHNHFANSSATVSFLATRFLGIKWSLTLHGHSETDYPAGLLLGAKLRVADFAACVSNFGRAQAYRTISPDHWSKLEIVRCALDLQRLPSPRPHVPGAPFRFISVARLSPEKGHSGLLQAFARVRRGDRPCELILIGDGPERQRLEHEIADLGLTSHVKMLGALSESETLKEIAKSDALVLASFIEGLPVVLMEAMALRKPVIAPHLAGIPDMIQHGENGLLFDAANWESLEQQLKRILTDEALRKQFAHTGRTTIEREFEVSKAVAPLIAKFRNLHG